MKTFHSLAIQHMENFIFGHSPNPLALNNGLVVGGGEVYPELNFTLPDMLITDQTMADVRVQYQQMIRDACRRAVELNLTGLVVEFELLPDLTAHPNWGAEITKILKEELSETQQRHGLKTALRVTPNDNREFIKPPLLRQGDHFEKMLQSFNLCAKAGADMLSIESTGGKEIHDEAILNGDLAGSVFSLSVLGGRDMAFLWDRIVEISMDHQVVPASDTACGFANTAMVLAEQRFIPRVWAALIRVLAVPRSLVAFERGAIGPGKDCGYEGPFIKAITGYPISLEGAEAACAHLSPIGNITKAVPDLWSNESVQNIKLLGAMAPTVSLEQLAYATRLMNVAAQDSMQSARQLRDWFVASDIFTDPQAYVLNPEMVIKLSREIISESTPYLRTRRAAQATLACLRDANQNKELLLSKNELRWLDHLSRQADLLEQDEGAFIAGYKPNIDFAKIRFEEYGL
ncbi:MAG: methanol--corrinoid methyltransferase [Anaerolineae bacterium]|nr:methanol--corrinoid methyltransferase [Anaerolineae bacterium]